MWHKRHFPKGALVKWEQLVPKGVYDICNKTFFGKQNQNEFKTQGACIDGNCASNTDNDIITTKKSIFFN